VRGVRGEIPDAASARVRSLQFESTASWLHRSANSVGMSGMWSARNPTIVFEARAPTELRWVDFSAIAVQI
jgi:hypothetical protein